MTRAQPSIAKPRLLEAIAQGASVEQACDQAGCSTSAFYAWQKGDVEFMEGLTRARVCFLGTLDDSIHEAANRRLLRLLTVGEIIRREVLYYRKDESGEMSVYKKKVVILERGTPKWVFDKLMPESILDKAFPCTCGRMN